MSRSSSLLNNGVSRDILMRLDDDRKLKQF